METETERGSARSQELQHLIAEAKAGNELALEQLVSSVSPRLARFAQRLCGESAEDALQDALLHFALKISQFRDEAAIYSWAYTLVRTACNRQLRGLKNAPALPLSAALEVSSSPAESGPEAETLSRERSEALNCALWELDEDQRAAVLLRDVEELSAEEAARALAITVPALKSRLHRGRKRLSALLEGDTPAGKCPDVIGALSRQLEGELEEGKCAELSTHLGECHGCSERCARLKRLVAACQELPPPWSPVGSERAMPKTKS